MKKESKNTSSNTYNNDQTTDITTEYAKWNTAVIIHSQTTKITVMNEELKEKTQHTHTHLVTQVHVIFIWIHTECTNKRRRKKEINRCTYHALALNTFLRLKHLLSTKQDSLSVLAFTQWMYFIDKWTGELYGCFCSNHHTTESLYKMRERSMNVFGFYVCVSVLFIIRDTRCAQIDSETNERDE